MEGLLVSREPTTTPSVLPNALPDRSSSSAAPVARSGPLTTLGSAVVVVFLQLVLVLVD